MAGSIRGILFDLGDTVLDFGKVDITTLFEAGARLAYDYLLAAGQPMPAFAQYHRQQKWAIRWSYFKSRFTRREFNSLELIGRLASRMGHQLSPQQMAELAWLWYKPLANCATVESGLGDLLAGFADQGLTLGLVSNTFVPGSVLDRHLRELGLLDYLPHRTYSCDVGFRKPNPKIFKIALARAGLAPHETLFVGDSPKADVRGAGRLGMITVLKDPRDLHTRLKTPPTHRIGRLAEMKQIVQQYRRS